MGKPIPALVEGDTLTGFVADPPQDQFDRAFLRALLRYVRRLERKVGRASGCAAATPATPATLF
jgi:hypothetical protein